MASRFFVSDSQDKAYFTCFAFRAIIIDAKPETMAMIINITLAILLKSKKPLPVTVIAAMKDKAVIIIIIIHMIQSIARLIIIMLHTS